jgi:hypothetical protein
MKNNRILGWFWKAISTILVFVVISSIAVVSAPVSSASAAGWSGWAGMTKIAILPSSNEFLTTASLELQTYLGRMSGRTWTIVNGDTTGVAVRLDVQPASSAFTGKNDEAFRIVLDSTGVRITGKTAIAAREGAYTLLNKLGVRWFFKNSAWEVVPSSLADLGAMDEVQQPAFIWRRIWSPYTEGWDKTIEWRHRNRLGGAAVYQINHSYLDFMPTSDYATYPNAYLPEGSAPTGVNGWQVKPDDPTVVSRAIAYAQNYLNRTVRYFDMGDLLPYAVAPVSPNDGGGWGTYGTHGNQYLTDKVVGLTNAVGQAILGSYPGKYAGVYNYSNYSEVPTFNLSSNVMVEITTAYDYTELNDTERIRGLKARGAMVGAYDYYDPWVWNQEAPATWSQKVWDRIKMFYGEGVSAYTAEGGDSWGSAGLTYYVGSQLAWDPTQSIPDILNDFYTKAFGPASVPMARYYERWLGGRTVATNSMALAFRDLAEAQQLASAAGRSDVLERIRQIEFYMRYEWLEPQMSTMSLDDLKNFYTFVTKTRDYYIVYHTYVKSPIRTELTNRGLTTAQIDALIDYTLPTTTQADTWLNEALTAFQNVNAVDAAYIDPENLTLVALNDTTHAVLTPSTSARESTVLVQAQAGDTVRVSVKTLSASDGASFDWYGPQGTIVQSIDVPASGSYQTINLNAPSTGKYKLIGNGGINVLSHPAGFIEGQIGSGEFYLYVPQGTTGLVIDVPVGAGTSTLYNPSGALASTIVGGSQIVTCGITNPQAGVWKFNYSGDQFWTQCFQIYGVPDLVGYDARYLLVPATGSNNAPVANNQSVTTNEDTAVGVTLSATDADSNPLTYSVVASPAHGTLSGTAPALTYTPTANYNGADSFTFRANDGTANSNTATVSITVNAVNDAPVASNQNVTTNEDTAVGVTLSATDADGNPLTYSVVASPAHGTLSGTAPSLTYTPTLNYVGSDTFTFRANDGTVNSNTATVSITVNTVNDAPVANNQSVTTNEDTAVGVTLSATDADGNPLTYSVVASPAHGTLSGTAPALTYTPTANYNGADSFTFRANDGTVNSNTATVSITVNAVNDAPVANAQSATTSQNVAAGVTLSATDADGNPLTYTVVAGPAHGSLSGTAPNLTYTPTANYNGSDNFTFRVNDGTVNSNTAMVSITVNAPTQSGRSDVNSDGVVNILDIIAVTQHWGNSGASGWIPADVNNDGKIDVLDITLIGQNWTN